MQNRIVSRAPKVTLMGVVATVVFWCPPAASAQTPTETAPILQELLGRASRWTASFLDSFASVMVEERYEQVERTYRDTADKRSTRAEMLLLRLPQAQGWVHFRDVFDVNGRPVTDRRDRLQRLFLDSPDTALRDARRLTDESSRYNLDTVFRTINVPTFGLLTLDGQHADRFEFTGAGDERIDGRMVARVRFVERRGGSLVKTLKGEPVPLEGTLWLERDTGRVMRTLVKTRGTQEPGRQPPPFDGQVLMWVQTNFGLVPPSGAWAPVEMREWSRSSDLREVSGTATYSNLREFAVDTATSFRADGR